MTAMTLNEDAARTYTVQEVASATGATRHQIEGWLTRGHIKPEHTPAPPAPRQYSFRDLFDIAVFAEMFRLGIPAAKCESKVTVAPGIERGDVLVFWQGPIDLISATDRATGQAIGGQPKAWYDPANPPFHCRVFPLAKVADLVADPDKRALGLVNLAHVEARVLAKLAGLDAS